MGETLTVRLFVSTQTYDIPCDPRQPARWLLQQAKNIQRANLTPQQKAHRQQQQQANEIQDELEVLYNRSRRTVIELDEPIGRSISAMDVIDARTLLQTPDTTNTSTLFPWLNSYSGGPKVNDENLNSANGLFFQQLYAYTLIGRRTPQTASQRREKKKREDFLDLLKAYVVGSFEEDQPQIEVSYASTHHQGGYTNGYPSKPQQHPQQQQQQPTYYTRPTAQSAPPANSAVHGTPTPARRSSDFPTIKGFFSSSSSSAPPAPTPANASPASVRRKIEYADRDSDSGSEHADDNFAQRMISMAIGGDATPSRGSRSSLPPPSPSPPVATLVTPSTPVRRSTTEVPGNLLDEMESVFDVVFKQQQIGLKLAMDEYKQYAIVKECLPNTEAQSYTEIQSGVVVLAVNGQEVNGLGLARLLYRLREVPRPVVIRFGRIAQRGEAEERQKRFGTWG